MDTNPSHEFTHASCDPIHIPSMDHHHQQQQQQQLSFDSIWPNPRPVPGFFRDHILGQILTDNQALEKAEELPEGGGGEEEEEEEEELGAMKEMMYRIAAMQPVDIDPSTIRKPKRRNVRISHDPQSIAARHRRERISERIRILQRMVPGGTKLDTASMLDEAVRYVKFLKRQIRLLKSNYSDDNNTDVNPPPPPPPLSCIGAKTTADQLASDDWVPPPGSTVVSTTGDLSSTQQYGFSFGGA